MIPIAGQFLLGFGTIVVGFGASLNLLYGSMSESWSSLHQFFSSVLNALTGYGNTVTNENFTPYAYLWIGDIFLLLYLILSSIICINMLIAMMGNEFNFLVQHQILKRKAAFARGDMYFQAEKFLLPPPLNVFHLMVLGYARCVFPRLKFRRWLPKVHKPAYLHTILLKEMYLEYRAGLYSGDGVEREIELPSDSDSDDTTNANRVENLSAFVDYYIRKTFRAKHGEDIETLAKAHSLRKAESKRKGRGEKERVPTIKEENEFPDSDEETGKSKKDDDGSVSSDSEESDPLESDSEAEGKSKKRKLTQGKLKSVIELRKKE